MIFKTLYIKNFRSYYGDNKFDFRNNGLTLIVGGNGDGKTTFFEALQWLCNTTLTENDNNQVNFSEMRRSEMSVGETEEVKVALDFFDDGDKTIEKSFTITRDGEKKFSTGKLSFLGYESDGIDRKPVIGGGGMLVKRYYDAFIRRFSLFKGESTLNVFNDATALKQLVDTFSNVKEFDRVAEMTASFEQKSNRQYLKECTNDRKIADEAKQLENLLESVTDDLNSKRREIRSKKESLNLYVSKLENLEQAKESSQKYKDISDRLEEKETEARRLRVQVERTNFNTALLDKLWILCAFEPVFGEFKQKVSALSKEKRTQEKDFIAQKNKELGKIEAQQEILGALQNGTAPLPWYLPDEETMEEMLHDGICKVCGRPVEKGSEAYKFMSDKLNDYKEHVRADLLRKKQKKLIEDKELFKNHYIEDLHNLSISLSGNREAEVSQISNDINDELNFVAMRREDLKKVVKEVQDATEEKARLLIKVGVSEDVFEKTFADIKGLFDQREQATTRIVELEKEQEQLESRKKELENQLDNLSPANSQVKVFKDVHHVFDLIAKAFQKARDDNFTAFLQGLEEKANEKLQVLSTSDFHGRVHIHRTWNAEGKVVLSIQLLSSNGTVIQKMSGSQETLMYISVLFAIRDFTQKKRDEAYPLIFDAATSSFGDEKEEDFYKVFSGIDNQCIIVTKDFIHHGELDMDAINGIDAKVYQIKKQDGYDQENLATIRTNVKEIK